MRSLLGEEHKDGVSTSGGKSFGSLFAIMYATHGYEEDWLSVWRFVA